MWYKWGQNTNETQGSMVRYRRIQVGKRGTRKVSNSTRGYKKGYMYRGRIEKESS